MMDMQWLSGNAQFHLVVVGLEHEATGSDNETYDLPSWALPTLRPNLSSPFSSVCDFSNGTIPTFELDIPSKQEADEEMEMDGLYVVTSTDSIFRLQFRFDDLLDPSHLRRLRELVRFFYFYLEMQRTTCLSSSLSL